jgi:AcrR family transcriptional regulator
MRESTVKDRILDTASRLFYDQGYHITGINQIIDEADIARASLYNHFPSKTDLLLAIWTERISNGLWSSITIWRHLRRRGKS